MKILKIFSIIIGILLLTVIAFLGGYYVARDYSSSKVNYGANQSSVTKVTILNKSMQGAPTDTDAKKKEIKGLVMVSDYDDSIAIDLRYATNNNFTEKVVYNADICALQKGTLNKLIAANNDFKKLGYRIKIWDAYRPVEVQEYFWELVKDRRYIASPYVNGSRHNRGAAVDITLVDAKGNELEMPTGFDEFNPSAHRNNTSTSKNARFNASLLTEIMVKHGFAKIETEWWHFDDTEADNYPILDVKLEDFLK